MQTDFGIPTSSPWADQFMAASFITIPLDSASSAAFAITSLVTIVGIEEGITVVATSLEHLRILVAKPCIIIKIRC